MKAAVYYGPGDVRVEERPDPEATDDNLIATVEACAICGTDLKISTAGNPRCHPPRIIGHEMVGTIEHVGKDVEGFVLGERVHSIASGFTDARFVEMLAAKYQSVRCGISAALAELISDSSSSLYGKRDEAVELMKMILYEEPVKKHHLLI